MIYILGRNDFDCFDSYNDLEDVVFMASTKIDDILEYVYTNIGLNYYCDYTILVKENGDLSYGNIGVGQYAYENFVKYTPHMFLKDENKNEFEYVKNQLRIWCDAIKEKKKREQEERHRIYASAKEKQERKLYEELKAKYGD